MLTQSSGLGIEVSSSVDASLRTSGSKSGRLGIALRYSSGSCRPGAGGLEECKIDSCGLMILNEVIDCESCGDVACVLNMSGESSGLETFELADELIVSESMTRGL